MSKAKPEMKYTVVLLRPDYLAEVYGEDTFVACVKGTPSDTFASVIKAAQQQVFKMDKADGAGPTAFTDYKAIAIFEGHHECLYWAWMS